MEGIKETRLTKNSQWKLDDGYLRIHYDLPFLYMFENFQHSRDIYVGVALEGCPLELVPPKPILSTSLLVSSFQLACSLYCLMPLILYTSSLKPFNLPMFILLASVLAKSPLA